MKPPFLFGIAGGLIALALGGGVSEAVTCNSATLFDGLPAIAGPGVTQVLTARLDSDVLADLVIIYGAAGRIEVRRHDSGTQFTTVSSQTWGRPILRALLADVDGDHRTDLAFTDDSSQVVIDRGAGDGTFTFTKTLPAPFAVFDLAAADFGNGGSLEFVVSHRTAGRITTFVSTSGLNYSAVTTDINFLIPDPLLLAVGKFNGDQLWDVAVSGASERGVYLLTGKGTGSTFNYSSTNNLVPPTPATSLEATDLDGDGFTDLIIGSNSRVEWVYGLVGPSGFSPGSFRDLSGGPMSDIVASDVNSDGFSDILCTRQGSSLVTAIVMTGSRTSSAAADFIVDGQPASVALCDLGGTSGPDLIVGTSTGTSCLVSRCDPPGPPPPPPPPPADQPPSLDPPPRTIPMDEEEGPAPPQLLLSPPPQAPDPGTAPVVSAWPASGVAVCDAPGEQSELVGTDDFAHGAYFAWIDERSGQKDVYATRLGPDGQRVAGWPANGVPVCTAAGARHSLSCMTDGPWGVWLLWLDDRNGSTALYMQKLTPDGRVATGWPANGRQVCTAASSSPVFSYEGWPDLFGGLRLGWNGRTGASSKLFAQHLDTDGQPKPSWPACGTSGDGDTTCYWNGCSTVCSSINHVDFRWPDGLLYSRVGRLVNCPYGEIPCYCYEQDQTLVMEMRGNASSDLAQESYSAWAAYDEAGGYYLSHGGSLERVGACGHQSWGPITTAAYNILPTPSGQFFLLEQWDPFDIRRLEDDGSLSPGFVAGQQPLCDPPCNPTRTPQMVEDGSGGVFLAWPDSRGDLYATWYGADGKRRSGWASNGDPVTSLAGSEELGPLVSDRRGSFIVGWRDRRNGDGDLYARRFTNLPALAAGAHGTTTTPDAAVRTNGHPTLHFAGARPNPSAIGLAVEFSLSRAGDARVRVLDVAGREVHRREFRGLSAGMHVIELDDAHALAPGIYVLEFVAEGRVFDAKAVVTR